MKLITKLAKSLLTLNLLLMSVLKKSLRINENADTHFALF